MTSVEQIVQRLDELEKRFATAERERDEYRALYLETMDRCRKLELGILASKSEHLADGGAQLSLDVLSMVLGDRQRAELEAALAAANEEQEIPAHTRRKPTGRKPLPEHLPRVEIQVLPPEVEKKGLDAFERIGEDVCETIERRPASLVVARVIRPKFVAKDRQRDAETEVFVAEPLELPIREDSRDLACSRTRSSGAGRTTCPSIASRTCTLRHAGDAVDMRSLLVAMNVFTRPDPRPGVGSGSWKLASRFRRHGGAGFRGPRRRPHRQRERANPPSAHPAEPPARLAPRCEMSSGFAAMVGGAQVVFLVRRRARGS